jgi:CubicO group peptidase (beta-lactamase class C family)
MCRASSSITTISRTITVRDMLSHRTGITRHDLIWYKSDFSQKDLFERLQYLEPSEAPRSGGRRLRVPGGGRTRD